MVELFRAEWIKLLGNRYMSALIVWVFPVGMLAFMVVSTLFVSFAAVFGEGDMAAELGFQDIDWTNQVISVWSFPTGLFGRLLVLALTALVFAGEYQWNTWKAIVPRSRRVPLILVKFVTVALFIVFAFALMSILLTLGMGLVSLATGASYGPPLRRDDAAGGRSSLGRDGLRGRQHRPEALRAEGRDDRAAGQGNGTTRLNVDC